MTPHNLNVILLATFLSILCYVTSRWARPAMMVGNALDLIDQHYVDPIDDETLLKAAMNGMTEVLDENSSFIAGDAYGSFQDSIDQEFAGIGIFVEQPQPEQPVRVITPLVGSPALKAGLMPGDLILEVDGRDVRTMPLAEVSDLLRGPVETTVKISVQRRDDEVVSLVVKRKTIELESVIGDHRNEGDQWVYRLYDEPSIAYLRLTSFGEKTVDELRGVLLLLNNDFDALVLDLRGNSGGLLYAAVDVCDMFLNSGSIVSTRVRNNVVEEEHEASAGTIVSTDKPMAVLVDSNSASASEIVSAALQDNGRAVVVGTRSYGKGTVQNILPLQYGRSALRLTVARYYRPSGKNIHRLPDATDQDEWGVTPNEGFRVELDEDTLEKLARHWREASYPMLATDNENAEDENTEDAGDDPVSESDQGSGTDEASSPGALSVDPQLRRAVDYLLEQIRSLSESEVRPLAA